MYTIEYYKTKREKQIVNGGQKRQEINDICWNIKSLTIEIEDLKHIMLDRSSFFHPFHLYSLYAKINRMNYDKNINSITILNNNIINELYIYEIINCKWMVNADEEVDESKLLKNVKRLLELIDINNKTTNQRTKRYNEDEIKLIKYYINTVIRKKENNQIKTKTMKLGKNSFFIRTKKQENN